MEDNESAAFWQAHLPELEDFCRSTVAPLAKLTLDQFAVVCRVFGISSVTVYNRHLATETLVERLFISLASGERRIDLGRFSSIWNKVFQFDVVQKSQLCLKPVDLTGEPEKPKPRPPKGRWFTCEGLNSKLKLYQGFLDPEVYEKLNPLSNRVFTPSNQCNCSYSESTRTKNGKNKASKLYMQNTKKPSSLKCTVLGCSKYVHKECFGFSDLVKSKNFECPDCYLLSHNPLIPVQKILMEPRYLTTVKVNTFKFFVSPGDFSELIRDDSVDIEIRCIKPRDEFIDNRPGHTGQRVCWPPYEMQWPNKFKVRINRSALEPWDHPSALIFDEKNLNFVQREEIKGVGLCLKHHKHPSRPNNSLFQEGLNVLELLVDEGKPLNWWTPDFNFAVGIYLVKRITVQQLCKLASCGVLANVKQKEEVLLRLENEDPGGENTSVANRSKPSEVHGFLSTHQSLPRNESKQFLSGLFSQNGGIEVSELRCTTVCTLTLCPINFPVRGRYCRHAQCFSLDSLATLMAHSKEVGKLWLCLICRKECHRLIFDEYMMEILRKVKAESTDEEDKVVRFWTGGNFTIDDASILADSSSAREESEKRKACRPRSPSSEDRGKNYQNPEINVSAMKAPEILNSKTECDHSGPQPHHTSIELSTKAPTDTSSIQAQESSHIDYPGTYSKIRDCVRKFVVYQESGTNSKEDTLRVSPMRSVTRIKPDALSKGKITQKPSSLFKEDTKHSSSPRTPTFPPLLLLPNLNQTAYENLLPKNAKLTQLPKSDRRTLQDPSDIIKKPKLHRLETADSTSNPRSMRANKTGKPLQGKKLQQLEQDDEITEIGIDPDVRERMLVNYALGKRKPA